MFEAPVRGGEPLRISGWNYFAPQKLQRWGYRTVKISWSFASTVFDWSTRVADKRTDQTSAPTAWDFSQDLGNLGVDLGFGDFEMQTWDFYSREWNIILSVILTSDDLTLQISNDQINGIITFWVNIVTGLTNSDSLSSSSSSYLFSDNNMTQYHKIAIQSEGCQRSLTAHSLAAQVKKMSTNNTMIQ